MKKAIVMGVVVVGAVAAGVVWLRAAPAPTVGALSATPAYVVINTPTPVVITAQITDSSLIASSVNLLKVDATGKALATIGVMRDDGANGDAVAGDKTFSYRLSANEPAVKQVYYRVSAAFKGVLQRQQSVVVTLSVRGTVKNEAFGVQLTYPPTWDVSLATDGFELYGPAHLSAAARGDLVVPPDIYIVALPMATDQSLESFAQTYAEGIYTNYAKSRREQIGPYDVLVYDDSSATVSSASDLVGFVEIHCCPNWTGLKRAV